MKGGETQGIKDVSCERSKKTVSTSWKGVGPGVKVGGIGRRTRARILRSSGQRRKEYPCRLSGSRNWQLDQEFLEVVDMRFAEI
jgi:hypothetical protein